MTEDLRNQLGAERERRGWTRTRAAEVAGISRQSYAAIESGRSVPSTDVALRLARGMGLPVESLFRLGGEAEEVIDAVWAGPGKPRGKRIRLARIAGRLLAGHAADGARSPSRADGVVVSERAGGVRVRLLPDRPPPVDLVVVGCDPSFGIVAEFLRSTRGIEVAWNTKGSRSAIESLARGETHIAGAHLRDQGSGETNGPWIRADIPFPCTRVVVAEWEQAILVSPGVSRRIKGVEDLADPAIRFLNREPGAGSRLLFDHELEIAGIPTTAVNGYETAARSHFAVAEAIASGLADAGVGIRAAAAAFELNTVALCTETYELIIPDHYLDLPAVGALLDALRTPAIRAQIGALKGYDVTRMGMSP